MRRCATVDSFEKLQKFLMAMSFHTLPDNLAFQNIQCGKQCRGAVALVIMRHRARPAFLHRQSGLRAVKRLYLCLFVKAEHQSVFRRAQIKADDIFQLFNEARIVRQLECLDQMRLQPVRIPNALHGCFADAADPGHLAATPVRLVLRSRLRFLHNLGFPGSVQRLETAPTRTIIIKGFHAAGSVTSAPINDGRTRCFQRLRQRVVRLAVRRTKHNPRPQRNPLLRLA